MLEGSQKSWYFVVLMCGKSHLTTTKTGRAVDSVILCGLGICIWQKVGISHYHKDRRAVDSDNFVVLMCGKSHLTTTKTGRQSTVSGFDIWKKKLSHLTTTKIRRQATVILCGFDILEKSHLTATKTGGQSTVILCGFDIWRKKSCHISLSQRL